MVLGWATVLPVASIAGTALNELARVPEQASMLMQFGWGQMLGTLTVFGVGLAALVEGFVRSRPLGVESPGV